VLGPCARSRLGTAAVALLIWFRSIGPPVFAGTPEKKPFGLAYMMGPEPAAIARLSVCSVCRRHIGGTWHGSFTVDASRGAPRQRVDLCARSVVGARGTVLVLDQANPGWGLEPRRFWDLTKPPLAAIVFPQHGRYCQKEAWMRRNLSRG